jgi:hypothetical protein
MSVLDYLQTPYQSSPYTGGSAGLGAPGSWTNEQINWLLDTPEGQDHMRSLNKQPWTSPLGHRTGNQIASTLLPIDPETGNWSMKQLLPWNAGLLNAFKWAF